MRLLPFTLTFGAPEPRVLMKVNRSKQPPPKLGRSWEKPQPPLLPGLVGLSFRKTVDESDYVVSVLDALESWAESSLPAC